MKKFLIKTIILLFPLLILIGVIEGLLRNVPNNYKYKADYLNKNAKGIETLILGTSHGYRDFNPKYLPSNTFNVAYKSQSLEMDYKIFKKNEFSLNNLQNIIIPVSYPSFYYNMKNEDSNWRNFNYYVYYNLSGSFSIKDYFEILNNLPYVTFLKLKDYYCFNKSQLDCDSKGFSPLDRYESINELKSSGKIRVKKQSRDKLTKQQAAQAYKMNVKYLKYFIDYCEENSIQLYLITTPTYRTFYENIDVVQLKEMYQTVDSLSKGKKNTHYYDFLKDQRFKADDFHDADHLSGKGAKKLSIIMDSLIISND